MPNTAIASDNQIRPSNICCSTRRRMAQNVINHLSHAFSKALPCEKFSTRTCSSPKVPCLFRIADEQADVVRKTLAVSRSDDITFPPMRDQIGSGGGCGGFEWQPTNHRFQKHGSEALSKGWKDKDIRFLIGSHQAFRTDGRKNSQWRFRLR